MLIKISPEPKMTSAKSFFCLTNSLKPKDSLFTVMDDEEKTATPDI